MRKRARDRWRGDVDEREGDGESEGEKDRTILHLENQISFYPCKRIPYKKIRCKD